MISIEPPVSRVSSKIPLYVQIAQGFLEQIESGQITPGMRLPPERELSKMLGVNRMTLRQALHMLETRGLLIRRQGAGTFVAEPKIERQADELVSFSLGMKRRGYLPGARVIEFDQRLPEASVARELRIPVSESVYYFQRVRLLNQEPVMLETFWMPVKRIPELEKYDLAQRPLYEILETDYGISVVRARQSLEPVVATEFEAHLLGIEPGAPLMLERRLAFDQLEEPVEYGKDLYRGDRFRFVTEMAPMER